MRRLSVFLAALALVLVSSTWAAAQEPDGRAILQRVMERHFQAQAVEEVAVALIDEKGHQRNMAFTSYTKRQDNGLVQNMIWMTAPGNVKGTALVTWLEPGATSKQWLYLPSQIMTRQVGASGRTSPFLGTDFTFEDLEPLSLDHFDVAVAGSETLDGQDCWLLEVTPADDETRKSSGYAKRVLAVRKDIDFVVRIRFHDLRGRLEKTQVSGDLVNLGGEAWAANNILMQAERPEHKTLMVVRSRDTRQDIPDAVFTELYVRQQQKQVQ